MDKVTEFLTYLKVIENKSENTIKAYSRDLKDFSAWYTLENESDCDFAKVSKNDLYNYMSHRVEMDDSPSTRARRTSTLKVFFKYLYDNDYIEKDIASGLKSPKIPHKEPVFASREEAKELINSCVGNGKQGYTSVRDLAMFSILLNCGLRRTELVSLGIECVNHSERSLLVYGKGAKERTVYMNDSTYELLCKYLKLRTSVYTGDSEALFLTRTGNSILPNKVNDIMNKMKKDCGLSDKNYTPHTFRKTCATLLSQQGVDIRTIQRTLGHSNIETTTIYVGVEERQKAAAGREFNI